MKTILLVPYRNRKVHLEYFLKNTWPRLKRETPAMEMIVVEQLEGKKFNRALMLNIGYRYYNNKEYYYITQDIDVNPISDTMYNMYKTVVEDNVFFSIYSDSRTLGGIVKFKGGTFEKVNGFPNDYWGWGHEDKDIADRAHSFKCQIKRFLKHNESKKLKKHFNIFYDRPEGKRLESDKYGRAYEWLNRISHADKIKYFKSNGLTTMKYKVLKKETLMEGVVKITVQV